MKRFVAFPFAVFLTACSAISFGNGAATPFEITAVMSTVIAETPGPPSTEGPSPTAVPATLIPTLPSGLSPAELKYRVLEEFPDFFFCDPDFYPIAREDEMTLALQAFPDLQANREEFQAIVEHTGLDGSTTFTDEQKLQIYREHKKLNALFFEAVEDRYRFQIQTGMEGQQGSVITGTIDGRGSIDVFQREQGFPSCPICLAAGTLIDTPRGAVRVEDLKEGDAIWTMDEAGRRVPASILRTGHMIVPAGHQMVHVTLSDGRELWASPGHPTSDGRTLGEVQRGNTLDGASIVSLEQVPYQEAYTYDILPAGATGIYWANGILMGSTFPSP